MSEVFISYAREDQAVARDLYHLLKSRGFRIWWDAELLASDDFYEVILKALSSARAAIVIWTKSSVKSPFVRDEARFALHHKKLIAVKTAELNVYEIPFGFQGQHTDHVSEHDRIVMALERLGARSETASPPESAMHAATEQQNWARIKDSTSAEELFAFLDRYPETESRTLVLRRLRGLLANPPRDAEPEIKQIASLRLGNIASFFSGLTLRVPDF